MGTAVSGEEGIVNESGVTPELATIRSERTFSSGQTFSFVAKRIDSPRRRQPSKGYSPAFLVARRLHPKEIGLHMRRDSAMAQESTSLLSNWRSLFGLCLIVAFWSPSTLAQSAEEMMGVKEGHCSIAQGTVDGKTFACMVWDHDPARFSDPTQIEIYRRHRRICTIEPGGPIREWHFWREGKELAVYYGTKDGLGTHALYRARTGQQVDHVLGSPQPRSLPQWSKSQSQLAEESLPEGVAFSQQQTLWVLKVMSEIGSVRAGMTRKELLKVFGEEGGLSTRTNRTYVYKGCRYIKVNVVFLRVDADEQESADDKIVSISGPYLAYAIMD